jgi:hypothetical protein
MRISLKIVLDLERKEPVEEDEEVEDYNDITAITDLLDPNAGAVEIGFRGRGGGDRMGGKPSQGTKKDKRLKKPFGGKRANPFKKKK